MLKILKERSGWVTVIGIGAIILGITNTAPENFQTWQDVFNYLYETIKNPYVVFSILIQLFAMYNNPTDKKHF